MKNFGVICEYNPFHNGHARQLSAIHQAGTAVCLMSGSYVQRGEPAVLDKYARAKAAILCGADLVLELPVTYSLRSAEGFAAGGVELLNGLGCIDGLCFGSEGGKAETLMETAKILLTEELRLALKNALVQGVSFPKARELALEAVGGQSGVLKNPNDILAVEYCKAILRQNASLKPLVLKREGSYHESCARENPSATVLRGREDWEGFVPEAAMEVFKTAQRYSLKAGERAWLARLRAMTEEEFSQLPFGTEGLWRKVMGAVRSQAALEDIVSAVKSKRYTRTRIMRMLLCAYLGITEQWLAAPAPYVRVLAMNEIGQKILHQAKKTSGLVLLHPGDRGTDQGYAELERRCDDLYELFREGTIPPAGRGKNQRLLRL